MNTFKHVLFTWLLSHVLHPLLFCLALLKDTNHIDTEILFIISVVSPIISIPSLFLCYFFLNCLRFTNGLPLVMQGLWFILVPVAIVINLIVVLSLASAQEIIKEEPTLFLPAIIASLIAILIRTKQFQHLFTYKLSDNETDLV